MSHFTLLHYIDYISPSLRLTLTQPLFISLLPSFFPSLSASLSSSSISLFSDLHGARSSGGPGGRHHSLRWGEQGGQEEARGGAVDLDSCYLMMFVVCAVEWCVRCDVRF